MRSVLCHIATAFAIFATLVERLSYHPRLRRLLWHTGRVKGTTVFDLGPCTSASGTVLLPARTVTIEHLDDSYLVGYRLSYWLKDQAAILQRASGSMTGPFDWTQC